MGETKNERIPPDVRQRFVELMGEALDALRQMRLGLSLRDELGYALALASDPQPGQVLELPLVQKLHTIEKFHELFQFVWGQPPLRSVFVESSKSDISKERLQDPIFRSYVEVMLLRTVSVLSLESDRRNQLELLDGLVSFLNLPRVERRVVVPLMHLKLASETYVISGFGVLRKIIHPESQQGIPEEIRARDSSLVKLDFTIQTDHFTAAHLFPVSDEIRSRIALLRLVAHPLVSCNHFQVEHIRPWEAPLRDSVFWARFWAKPQTKVNVRDFVFEESHARQIETLQEKFQRQRWNQLTPWRLAIDRLDDALFKLECGSPDAILDLVIGLECVFVEPESRQESTHKVATRAARFLENTEQARRDTFRKVKEIYRVRSTLAHGQTWEMDQRGVLQVEEAALVLTRTLRRMIEERRTQLDVLTLDLA